MKNSIARDSYSEAIPDNVAGDLSRALARSLGKYNCSAESRQPQINIRLRKRLSSL
jgi:hypothetical protein